VNSSTLNRAALQKRATSNDVIVRMARRQTGHGPLHVATAANNKSDQLKANTNKLDKSAKVLASEASAAIVDDNFQLENDDPLKPAISHGRPLTGIPAMIAKLKRRIRFAFATWFPEPTEEELARIKQEKQDKAIKTQILIDARTYARIIPNRCSELAFDQLVHENDKTYNKKITYDVIAYDWTEELHQGGNVIKLHLDMRPGRMPRRIKVGDLICQATMNELLPSLGHPAYGTSDVEGVIHTIQRSGAFGLPSMVLFRDLLNKIPKDAPITTFLLGPSENGKVQYRALEAFPHFATGGETGSGKTVFMHNKICCMISRNSPKDLRMLMVDLKAAGTSLRVYEGIPHLITDIPDVPKGVANTVKEAATILLWCVTEMTRRNQMFANDKKHHIEKLDEWNRWHPNQRLPRIVVEVDEMAEMLDKSDVTDLEDEIAIASCRLLTGKLLKLSRSSGIHLDLHTQTLTKEVVGIAFKNNMPARLSFAVADYSASMLIVRDGSAARLEDLPGRAIFKRGRDRFECQTPFIGVNDILEIVAKVKKGETVTEFTSDLLQPEEVLQWAIENNAGNLGEDALYKQFGIQYGGRVGMRKIRSMITKMAGQEYEVNGKAWVVTKGTSGKNNCSHAIPAKPRK
jgi:DNA segregation ATPase FtsK/SpoIIIE-like protein